MKTIETTVIVGPDHKLIVNLPPDIPLGEHHVVVVLEEQLARAKQRPPLQFSAYPVGLVSDSFTFRREDL